MAIKFQLLTAVAVSQALFLTFMAVSYAPVEGENITGGNLLGDFNYPMTLQFIGVADGKSFFAEVNQTMNRTEAAAYCEASRLKLASIETKEQADMLNKVIPDLGFGGRWYWTSGKETRRDSMFMWNETGNPVSSSLIGRWGMWGAGGEYYCLEFFPNSTLAYLQAVPCTIRHRPLCHT